jgi:hypothetical protein
VGLQSAELPPVREAVVGKHMTSAALRISHNEAAQGHICASLSRIRSMTFTCLEGWRCGIDLVA